MHVRILVACEFSGIVREAFRKKGHEAVSCDLLSSEIEGPHIQQDVRKLLTANWDMLIAFPPCTFLSSSGARWWKDHTRIEKQIQALKLVIRLLEAPINKICLENPVGRISTVIRKPDQIIQPYDFGHGETKKTCLWLKNLPLLVPTDRVERRTPRVHHEPPSPERWKNRSRTYQGIADAMAEQWG